MNLLKNTSILTGLLLLASSCREAPKSAMEMSFEQNFVAVYGVIDPYQDWNLAQRRQVTLRLGSQKAKSVQVLAAINSRAYRLTQAVDLSGLVRIPFDMPKGMEILILDIDGTQYAVEPDGEVDPSVSVPLPAPPAIIADEAEDQKWLIVGEDLGTADDFDFNDFVLQIQVPNPRPIVFNAVTQKWEEKEETHGPLTPSRAGADLSHCVRLKALAAGGTLKLWLHYFDGVKDWVIGPGNNQGYILTKDISDAQADMFEWHQWIIVQSVGPNSSWTYEDMLNTDAVNPSGNPSNLGATVTIDLPIDDGQSVLADGPAVVAGNFVLSQYSVSQKSAYSNYILNVREGFYFTKEDYVRSIDYDKLSNTISHPVPGSAPHMFLIPDQGHDADAEGWYWPKERVNIHTAYPKFKYWVGNADYSSWYLEEYLQDKVYIRPSVK